MVHNKSVLNCSSVNFDLLASLIYSENQFSEVNSSRPPDKHKSKVQLKLKTRFQYKKGGPGGFTRSVVIQPSSSQHLILRFTVFLLVAHSAKFKMKYLSSKF